MPLDRVDFRQVFGHLCVRNRTAFYGEFEILGWMKVQRSEESSHIQAQTGSHAKNDATSKTAGLADLVNCFEAVEQR
jgi:hypothetical protein